MSILGKFRDLLRGNDMQRFSKRAASDNAAFDAKYAVDTALDIPLAGYDVDVGAELESGTWFYQCVHEGVLRSIIEAFAADAAEYEFVDIGSGKGKALLVASTYPFRRVRGVEFSPQLHETATRNIAAFGSAGPVKCEDVRSYCLDAREVSDFGANTLVFMFNPLSAVPMEQFVRRIEAEAQASGASMIIAYLAPRARRPLDESKVFACLLDSARLVVYGRPGASLSAAKCEKLADQFNNWRI
jgi:SAM-dependent methyltransferase